MHDEHDLQGALGDNAGPVFQSILERRLSRRTLLGESGMLGLAVALPFNAAVQAAAAPSTLSFRELPQGLDGDFAVAEGYRHQVLIRWGDPLFADAPAFDPARQSLDSQLRQFGYNNDFIGFVPLPQGSGSSDRGLLVVNHEYTDPRMMFPGSPAGNALNRAQTDVDIAAHGLSVIEIGKSGDTWQVLQDSAYNRRITPNTEMRMTGPAAGSERLKTLLSADGVRTYGTYGNCAGGVTPWGTILTGEENVDGYFSGTVDGNPEEENYRRFGMGLGRKSWANHYERWDLAKNPREPLHVGWIVEIDPFDPNSVPMKRTVFGRCKHEGCNLHVNGDGRVVGYTGDDAVFEYIYRFVSRDTYQPDNRAANLTLLEAGELSVARFHDDGRLNWLPLLFGQGPLTPDRGFKSQADVLLDLRKAADLLGATRMDRPEDVDVNPVNGRVYAMLTNNARRTAQQTDAANPRAANGNGQIIEFWPEDGDHTAAVFRWDMLLLAGNPAKEETLYHPGISANGWLSCPDNCAFDQLGNLWIATDGAERAGIADGVWACEVAGPNRALTRRFIRTPVGAEMCGPFFTPDSQNFFCAVQHPAEGGSFEQPQTRWPDFDAAMPPRPAVVVVTKAGGGRIGS
ncbi:MAG: PhoX family phosphatase [Pseudomonadales bacterium]|nr:PhoX family phosphatase [Pseudomonadales bacterium]